MASNISIEQKLRRPRGRPRSFDFDKTLDKIRTRFARTGFSGTSIENLSEATGLATPSLYNTFGDKRKMFLRSLDVEFEEVVDRLRHLRTDGPLYDRLVAYLKAATTGYHDADPVPGIAFGAALADSSDNLEVASRLRDFAIELETVAAGVLGPGTPPSAAALLATLATGLCLRSRSCASTPESLELSALSLLESGSDLGNTAGYRRASAGVP
jgi:AcrR family transcriptional regulator